MHGTTQGTQRETWNNETYETSAQGFFQLFLRGTRRTRCWVDRSGLGAAHTEGTTKGVPLRGPRSQTARSLTFQEKFRWHMRDMRAI